jgi:hypothetical protein
VLPEESSGQPAESASEQTLRRQLRSGGERQETTEASAQASSELTLTKLISQQVAKHTSQLASNRSLW